MPSNNENERLHAIEQGTDILQSVSLTRVAVDWQRSLPWWFFLSGFVRLGWRISHVVFGTVAVWLSILGWRIASVKLVERPRPLQNYPDIADFSSLSLVNNIGAIVRADWKFSRRNGNACGAVRVAGNSLGLFGGIICRRSVVELGARTTIGWTSAIKLVLSRLRAIFEAVGLPALATAGLCLVPLLLGMLARLGTAGEMVATIGVVLTFLLAIPMAWLLLLVVLGFPLMVAAIVTEKDSDAFDGLSRSAAYMFQRPVTILIWGVVVFVIISLLTWLVATIYSTSTHLFFAAYATGAGIDGVTELKTGFAASVWAGVRAIFGLIVYGLTASMFWAATAAIYLVVRREVDHTEYDELDLQEMGSPLALPPLDFGRDGVVEVGSPVEAKAEQADKIESSPITPNDSTP